MYTTTAAVVSTNNSPSRVTQRFYGDGDILSIIDDTKHILTNHDVYVTGYLVVFLLHLIQWPHVQTSYLSTEVSGYAVINLFYLIQEAKLSLAAR